jgi:hypothetical protein
VNKPYTCHNCGTVFDAFPSDVQEKINLEILAPPRTITVKCPGCYANGYTSVNEMIYTLDISGETPTLVTDNG